MKELADLPLPALITFGAVLAFIFAVRYWGLYQGQHVQPGAGAKAAEVAAVIVDPTALNRAAAAVEAHTAALSKLIEIQGRRMAAEEHMAIELDRIREEMRIQREVRRNAPIAKAGEIT